MKKCLIVAAIFACTVPAMAGDNGFGSRLQAKFQVRGCTICHDFFEQKQGGLSFASHKGRSPEICVACHSSAVTGFEHADEWFAQPGLYTSGMDAQQTCEAVKSALNAKFKKKALVARQLEKHLFEDPRVLWGIEGATPRSGMLPSGKKEADLVKGGLAQWRAEVTAWIDGGMECK
jgi:hypothetical protein